VRASLRRLNNRMEGGSGVWGESSRNTNGRSSGNIWGKEGGGYGWKEFADKKVGIEIPKCVSDNLKKCVFD
jgi:hypothetical protein